MAYIPNPIDTSDVVLPSDILENAEILAKNTHEVWAKGKIKEGYTYGSSTDEKLKKHKNLVSYEDLSAIEKEYDLNTALEAIRVLIKIGFKIERDKK